MRSYFLPLLVLLFVSLPLSKGAVNSTDTPYPVIGILTQPSPYAEYGYPATGFSYIAGSYVKHIESAGAQVVPIQWDLPEDELDSLLSQVNGVLFPGGGSTLISKTTGKASPFLTKSRYIVSKVLEMNRNGDYFPLWSICLGYEILVLSISTNNSILAQLTDGDDVARTINITDDGLTGMFSQMNSDLVNKVQKSNLSYFHHKKTPDPVGFFKDANLVSNFTVAAWTQDVDLGNYIAAIQGKVWPFFGTQYHPEKNSYEWVDSEVIPHSIDATEAQQYYAFRFVNESIQNNHRFDIGTFKERWVRLHKPIHLQVNFQFEQVFLFKNYDIYAADVKLVSAYPPGIIPPWELNLTLGATPATKTSVPMMKIAEGALDF